MFSIDLPLVKSVRLYAYGKELTEGRKTLEELSIQDRQTIYYEITVIKNQLNLFVLILFKET